MNLLEKIATAFLAVLVLSLSACQNPSSSSPSGDSNTDDPLVGTWTLKTYLSGGTVYDAGSSTQTGTLTATAAHSFTWSLGTNSNSSSVSGAWVKVAGVYTLTTTKGAVWAGVIVGTALTVTSQDASINYVYTK